MSMPPPPPPPSVPPPPSSVPPPPPYGVPAPGYGAPPPPGYAPSFPPVGKPPRPRVVVGAVLVMVGAALSFAGVFLPWLSAGGVTGNGLDDYFYEDADFDVQIVESPGAGVVVGALVVFALGLTLLLAGRVLAVAIVAIVAAAIGVVVGFAMLGIVSDTRDFAGGGSFGVGVILQPIGPLVALAGSIAATAKRRR